MLSLFAATAFILAGVVSIAVIGHTIGTNAGKIGRALSGSYIAAYEQQPLARRSMRRPSPIRPSRTARVELAA